MKYPIIIVFGALLLMLGGCANQQKVPSFALAQPEQGTSALHPDQMEKSGGTLVTFTAVLPPQFLVEVKHGVKGVWPLVAGHMHDKNASIEDGFCYAVESRSLSKNPWGIVPLQCAIIGTHEHFRDYRFALVNKDGGVWISAPAGGGMIDDRSWNFKKFEDDFDHRIATLEKVGKSLDEIDAFWVDQIGQLGLNLGHDVKEFSIEAQSLEWQEFRTSFITEMGYQLKLPNGDVVVSSVPRDEMVTLLSRNPRITRYQKFMSRLSIPIGTPEVIAFGTATSILNGGIAAFIDDEWQSRVARGSAQYRDSAEQMAFLFKEIQKSHADVMRYKNFTMKKRGEI